MSNKKFKFNLLDFIVLITFALFSFLLMWKTFQAAPGVIRPASRVWSDFGATIPLIRSFSFGSNFPPEYPIFSGAPIRYHFVFFYIVGTFEKLGLPLDWALNLPSSLTFFALLTLIYTVGVIIFKKRSIGILATLFFIFNGSLGFIEYFKNNPLTFFTLKSIVKNTSFTSFGPYDGNIVAAFWSLNIFTNQRHLALGYASFIALCIFLYRYRHSLSLRKTLLLGIIVGLFPFVHLAVFGVMMISMGSYFIVYPHIRKSLFVAGTLAAILALPQILYMGNSSSETSLFTLGYLVSPLTLKNFVEYWTYNLSLTGLLIPVGFILATKSQKKFIVPFLILFVIGNIIQVSAEMAANHKFFNLFVIGGNFLVSLTLVRIWNWHVVGKFVVVPLFCLLTLTGFIDIFPIFNDRYLTISDIPLNRTANFIYTNTPKDSVFMNSSYLFTPANLAGRKIFMGWPYFAWSAGYDTDSRAETIRQVYTSHSKAEICQIMRQHSIDYFTTQDTKNDPDYPPIDTDFFEKEFFYMFKDDQEQIAIYSVAQNCRRF